ncbi:MAG: tetratricopeptide repeat protein, partial [Chloroflexota bacterium]|nr:tetratricopeptide repeat protein [Chloroflexota bacterium]
PLAIELAAARIKLLSPEAMLQRLSNRLELLTAGARDLPARQQTLRNAIDWSYSLLDSKEQTLFTRLGVFVRGCTLEAIEAVCSTPAVPAGDLDVLELLQSLVDKSLVQEQGQDSGEPRFVMLEIIRDYALERLKANGEAEQMQRQHAAYYLALAERTAPELKGPRQSLWVARLEQEHDNLRAVLRWSLDRGEVETAARLGWAVWVFWWIHGHLSEGQRWMEEALARGNTLPARLRARAFCAAGGMAYLQGDYERAVSLCEACVALFPEVGDKGVKAYALHTLGHVTMGRRDYERAHIFLDESVQLFRELGDKWGESFGRAGLGRLALAQGDVERAIPLLEETLALGRELGNRFVIAWALAHLGHAALAQNDYERATPLFEESLELGHQLGDKMNVAECLDGLAGVAGAQAGDPEAALRAARLFGAAEALRDAIGATRPPFLQSHCERIAVTVAIQLGEDASAAWAEGRAIAMEQAITYALNRESN